MELEKRTKKIYSKERVQSGEHSKKKKKKSERKTIEQ